MSPVVEHVSGNIVEFEMGSLVPGTHYSVGVHAMKEAQKSDSAVTEFTTGTLREREAAFILIFLYILINDKQTSVTYFQTWILLVT